MTNPISVNVNGIKYNLGKCASAIYYHLAEHPDRTFGRSLLASVTGYRGSSGAFGQAISLLVELNLAVRHQDKRLQINPKLNKTW